MLTSLCVDGLLDIEGVASNGVYQGMATAYNAVFWSCP